MSNILSKNKIENINNYLFVDNIRIISIFSILLLHVSAILFDLDKSNKIYTNTILLPYFAFFQIGRFGNICFFIVSGFLFAITKNNKDKYVLKRWNKLKKPLIMFSLLCGLYVVILRILSAYIFDRNILLKDILLQFTNSFFFGWTWFIYSLLFVLYLMSYLIKINVVYIIIINIIITLAILINVHFNFMPIPNHNKLLLGFLPVFNIGYYLGTHLVIFDKITKYLSNNKMICIFLLFLTYTLSLKEAMWFYEKTDIDPWFNLRFFNQLYSVVCFLLMCTFLNKKINFYLINPRTDTVGIFFVHFGVIIFYQYILYIVMGYLFGIDKYRNIPDYLLFFLLIGISVLVLFTTLKIVEIIKKTKYSSFIGIS